MARKSTMIFKRIIHGYIPYILARLFCPKSDKLVYYHYIVKYGDEHHLFLFAPEYDGLELTTYYDNDCGMNYVFLPNHEKRLYFKRDIPVEKVKGMVKELLMEQDYRSPHRYFDHISEFKGKTLLDVGAAEGILSLMAIDYVEHAYLFECEECWIEALQKTFEPWKEKVTIVPKYVGDHDDDSTVRLDTFFQGRQHRNLFLKMDIEGMERKALAGAEKMFSERGNVAFSICTYHERDDYRVISSFLNRYGCQYQNDTGYWSHRIKSIMLRGHN